MNFLKINLRLNLDVFLVDFDRIRKLHLFMIDILVLRETDIFIDFGGCIHGMKMQCCRIAVNLNICMHKNKE